MNALCHRDCTDPHCRLEHPFMCDRCGREIPEEELAMCGPHGDVPMHEDCARARYGE